MTNCITAATCLLPRDPGPRSRNSDQTKPQLFFPQLLGERVEKATYLRASRRAARCTGSACALSAWLSLDTSRPRLSGRTFSLNVSHSAPTATGAAVAALLLHPSTPRATYERTRDAAVVLLRALEVETVCRDCLGGRCHHSGAAARESEAAAARGEAYGACGCRFHTASVESRQRRAALRELGLIPQD